MFEMLPRSFEDIMFSYYILPMFFYGGLFLYGFPVSLIVEFLTKKLKGLKRDVVSLFLYIISVMLLFVFLPIIYAPILAVLFSIVESIVRRLYLRNYWSWTIVFGALALLGWTIVLGILAPF